MRHIHALNADKVPRDDEFKFRERAKSLVDKWHEILSASKAAEGAVRKPATNGKPHAEDAGANANGREEANGKETDKTDEPAQQSEKDKMEIDAKEESAPDADKEDAPAEETTAPAATADESAPDVNMSETA